VSARPRKLLGVLRRADPAVRSLAFGLRDVVLDEIAPCHEHAFAMKNKAMLLFAATDRVLEDCICQIAVFAKHVTLAFPRGVDLHDPDGILRGSGKAFRHVRVERPSDLQRPAIRALLRQARANEVAGAADGL
jgi:uncharacterized protein DUF1801